MINYKKRLILVFFIAILLLISCTAFDTQIMNLFKKDYIYTNTYAVQRGRYPINYVITETKHVKYGFEVGKYTEEQRENFIEKVEALCDFIKRESKMLFKEPLSIYVSANNTLQGTFKKVFLNDLTVESVDAIAAFLQALSGNNANYGLCYGISCYISENLYGVSLTSNVSDEKLGQYYSTKENMSLMDLTIPTFQTVYFSEEQNKYAHSTAYYFVKDLIKRKGLKYSVNMLINSAKSNIDFDIEYTNEKNIWLEYIGAAQKCEVPIIPIRYELVLGKRAETYPYIIYTPSTTSYFIPYEEFQEDIGVTIMDYDYIKHYLNIYEQDMFELKKYLSPYFNTKGLVDCYFKKTDDKVSYYYNSNKSIEYASPLYAGVHEYVHYITWNDQTPVWMIEGIAEYCANYLEDAGIYRLKEEWFRRASFEKKSSFIHMYNINLDDTSSLLSIENMNNVNISLYNEAVAYMNNNESKPINDTTIHFFGYVDPNEEGATLHYAEAGSLVNYLIKTYGEDNFFKVYEDYSKLSDIYDKTYEELKEEWQTQLNNTMNIDYIIGPEDLKIAFFDTSGQYIPSKRSFVEILGGKTYEYVDCGLGRNKDDDDENPEINDFEGLDVSGKIALIQRGHRKMRFYKQVNNAAKAGAVGVIVYNDEQGIVRMLLEGVTEDIPAISISAKDGEILKKALNKKITVSEDFVGPIVNNYSGN